MKSFYIFLLSLMLSLGCQSQTPSPQTPETPSAPETLKLEKKDLSIKWLPYDEAFEKHEKTQKPLFLFFSMESCGVCQETKRSILTDFGIEYIIHKEYVATLITDKDNKKEYYELLEKYQVDTVPTFMVIGHDDKTLIRHSGGLDIYHVKGLLGLGANLAKIQEAQKIQDSINSLLRSLTGQK